jgi:hypothetical protein
LTSKWNKCALAPEVLRSDQVINYCDGNFMSRQGIDRCDTTLHLSRLPTSPQLGSDSIPRAAAGAWRLIFAVL